MTGWLANWLQSCLDFTHIFNISIAASWFILVLLVVRLFLRKGLNGFASRRGEVGVKERVKNVISYKKPAFWIVLASVTVGTVVAVCFLTDPVQMKDEGRREAYTKALELILYEQESPDGEDWMIGTKSAAFYDIDFDGKEELLVKYDDGHLGSPKLYIYDYDEKAGTVRKEFSAYESLIFYDNGIVKVDVTHMPGPIGIATDFWPYYLCKYNEVTDSYEGVADIYGWEKAFENYENRTFPKDADVDGDGMVYYIHTGDEYYLDTQAVDNDVYHAWVDSMIGDAEEIELSAISFIELPTVAPIPKG